LYYELADKWDHCEEKTKSERSEMALELINCYANDTKRLMYMCKGPENCFQTIPSVEDKVAYDVSLQKHSGLCLIMSKVSDPDKRFMVGVNRYFQRLEREYQSRLNEELAKDNTKNIATDQQTQKRQEVFTNLIHDEKCYNVSDAVAKNVNFNEDKSSKGNHTYSETKDFKNDQEFGSEFFTFYPLILTVITILNMNYTLLRVSPLVIRTWKFAIILEIIILVFAIIIESFTSLFTLTGLKSKMIWAVRLLSIVQNIHYYTEAIWYERNLRREFILQQQWHRQQEAFNYNIEQDNQLYDAER